MYVGMRGCLDQLLTIMNQICERWCRPDAGSLSSPPATLSSQPPWQHKTHGHSTVTMAQALNTVFVCQLL